MVQVGLYVVGTDDARLFPAAGDVAVLSVVPRPEVWAASSTALPSGISQAAFVVGVASYPAPLNLPACRFDAEDMAWLLHRKGYTVTRLIDPGPDQVSATFGMFVGSLAPGATVVIFFSGHGVQVNGVNFLIPLDALQLDRGVLASI